MKRPLIIMICVLVAIAAATGIVIITYDGPENDNADPLRASRTRSAWQLFSQARTLIATGHYQEAERILARQLRLYPESVMAQRLHGRAKYELGEYAEAADIFRQLIARDPQDAVSRNNLGQCLIRMQWIEAGIKELLHARELAPGTPFIDENLMQAYLALGDVKNASRYRFSAETIRSNAQLRVEPADAIRFSELPEAADEPESEFEDEQN